MILKNFRKILKKIKSLIKLKEKLKICGLFKKKIFFKCSIFFVKFNNNYKKKLLYKNIVLLYFLNNLGNIVSSIRTCYIFNTISVLNYKKKKKINFFYKNIFFIKNIYFFLCFFKKKYFLICLTIKSNIYIKYLKTKKKFLIIIGNEKKSIKKKFFFKTDILLKIKTYCKKSLNVNVVNGILLNKLI